MSFTRLFRYPNGRNPPIRSAIKRLNTAGPSKGQFEISSGASKKAIYYWSYYPKGKK